MSNGVQLGQETEVNRDFRQQTIASRVTSGGQPTGENVLPPQDLFNGCLSSRQHTLHREIERSGVGLHSGHSSTVRILPAAPHTGRYFVRVDLPAAPVIPATLEAVHQTLLSTELAWGDATVGTVEHLLAALAGMGVDNARIEITGAEVPLLDGSALPWVEAITAAGVVQQVADRPQRRLPHPVWVTHADAVVAAFPSDQLRFTYGIDFDLPAIGNQWIEWSPQQAPFAHTVAPARTFGLAHQIDQLQEKGLIKGGSLENALVCGMEGWLNPPLRFPNEPVRHKLLDLVGDLSLLGAFPAVYVMAYKASHHLHIQLAQRMAQTLLLP